MELVETINNRRSIRKYKDIDIPNELIEDLINSARLEPSAKNRQPWGFMIVKDKTQNEIFNLVNKDNMDLISVISIGYPNGSPKQRPRKKIYEVLEWYNDEK